MKPSRLLWVSVPTPCGGCAAPGNKKRSHRKERTHQYKNRHGTCASQLRSDANRYADEQNIDRGGHHHLFDCVAGKERGAACCSSSSSDHTIGRKHTAATAYINRPPASHCMCWQLRHVCCVCCAPSSITNTPASKSETMNESCSFFAWTDAPPESRVSPLWWERAPCIRDAAADRAEKALSGVVGSDGKYPPPRMLVGDPPRSDSVAAPSSSETVSEAAQQQAEAAAAAQTTRDRSTVSHTYK
jgi:hypothetical protein